LILKNLADDKNMERRYFLGLICYEAMYTNLVWDFFHQHKDIDFIINSTNDSWFGNYLENYQHDSVVKLRGVEFGRYFIRATLNGVTTAYNHLGEEIIPPSIIDTKTFRLVDAKVLQENTLYARFGSVLVWVMSFLLLVLQYSTSRGSRRL
jgi:apolipoprotein N-acyltransferase